MFSMDLRMNIAFCTMRNCCLHNSRITRQSNPKSYTVQIRNTKCKAPCQVTEPCDREDQGRLGTGTDRTPEAVIGDIACMNNCRCPEIAHCFLTNVSSISSV